jgi:alkylhydroperoxidase family enzyme
MNAYINPPKKIPWYLRLGLKISKKKTGKDLLPAQLLTWFPKAAISSGLQELLVANEKDIDERLLKLIRMRVSFMASCPFCVDMNYFESEKLTITDDEIAAIQGEKSIDSVLTFTKREKFALKYVEAMTVTPPDIGGDLMKDLKSVFSEKEIVIVAVTVAQVNYWARLNISLGVPPAGFSDQCKVVFKE